MEQLYPVDEVAYIRFASVYRQFKDINMFLKELTQILGKHEMDDIRRK
jgi:transcriptional repressor NrdR